MTWASLPDATVVRSERLVVVDPSTLTVVGTRRNGLTQLSAFQVALKGQPESVGIESHGVEGESLGDDGTANVTIDVQ